MVPFSIFLAPLAFVAFEAYCFQSFGASDVSA